jgi:thiol:disulfide interchange protein DsbD
MHSFLSNLNTYFTQAPLLAYIAVLLAGLMTSFEPCIYTMVPITVAFIGSKAGGSKYKGFILSIFYVLGIATTYSTLGAFAALTGNLFGEISTKPIVYFILGNICILLSLNLFDVYVIRMPAFLSRLNPQAKTKGIVSIYLLGLVSGLVAGPCTAAALGVILAYVATKQNVIYGISLLFTFSLGMGLILIVIGTFAGLVTALPKAGPWMNRIRRIFGFLLIAIAEYLFIMMGKRMI